MMTKPIADAYTEDGEFLILVYKNGDKYGFELYNHNKAEGQGLYSLLFRTDGEE